MTPRLSPLPTSHDPDEIIDVPTNLVKTLSIPELSGILVPNPDRK